MYLSDPNKLGQREAHIKIVFDGPRQAGKSTSLQYLAKHLRADVFGQPLGSYFFEFVTFSRELGNWCVKFNFYTLPGQARFKQTRSLILRDVDGIVFVADSRVTAAEENLRMLADLQERLHENGEWDQEDEVPLTMFYNKRDLNDIMSTAHMDGLFDLGNWRVKRLCGCALSGENVLNAVDIPVRKLAHKIGVRDDFLGSGTP
jgi:mutual gliding-motility protein MglA